MVRLFVAAFFATLLVVLVTAGDGKKSLQKRAGIQFSTNGNALQWICQVSGNGYTFCTVNTPSSTTRTSTTTTSSSSTTEAGRLGESTSSSSSTQSTTTTTDSTTSTSDDTMKSSTTSSTPSALELAHWCRFAANGSWIPFNQTFMHLECLMCHCGADHNILCNELQCMDLHCVDGTVPKNISGQCCPQCAYETVSTSCRMNGIVFPHGTRVTTVEDNVVCWCQSGSIECRRVVTDSAGGAQGTTIPPKDATAILYYEESSSYLPSGMTAYVVVIVIILVLMLGALLCCGCAVAYYYYYQNQQENMQQAYEQYYNNAGWQPVGADGVTAEDKEAEAAQQGAFPTDYPTGQSPQYIPPPYAVFNGPYEARPQGQSQV